MLKDIVLSKAMQESLRFHCFSLLEVAAVIYHSVEALDARNKKLSELCNTFADLRVKHQIEGRIAYEQDSLKLVLDNSFDQAVFALTESRDDLVMGYYRKAEMAIERGKKSGKAFRVDKYLIIDEHTSKQPVALFSTLIQVEPEGEYDGSSVGRLEFNAAGELLEVYSEEMPKERHIEMECADRFENGFVYVPSPFGRGEIVRHCHTGAYGVVETGPEELLELKKMAERKSGCLDWFDSGITVAFLNDDGSFFHDHVSPLCLDFAADEQPEETMELLDMASHLLQGKGSLDSFLYVYEDNMARKKASQKLEEGRPWVVKRKER